MNRLQPLLARWQTIAHPPTPRLSLQTELDHHDVARLQALADLYPGCNISMLMADLLHHALNELEEGFPYVHGERAVGEDEFGEPVYEDAGLTPRFLELTRKHLHALQERQAATKTG